MTPSDRYKWGFDCGVKDFLRGLTRDQCPFLCIRPHQMYDGWMEGYQLEKEHVGNDHE